MSERRESDNRMNEPNYGERNEGMRKGINELMKTRTKKYKRK